MVHFGVFVTNGDNETANQVFVDSGFDLDVTASDNSANSGGDLFFLSFGEGGGGGDFDWGESGFGLDDSGIEIVRKG